MLDLLAQITLGETLLALATTALLFDVLPRVLPDRIAGPGGWLIDTRRAE